MCWGLCADFFQYIPQYLFCQPKKLYQDHFDTCIIFFHLKTDNYFNLWKSFSVDSIVCFACANLYFLFIAKLEFAPVTVLSIAIWFSWRRWPQCLSLLPACVLLTYDQINSTRIYLFYYILFIIIILFRVRIILYTQPLDLHYEPSISICVLHNCALKSLSNLHSNDIAIY